MKKQEPEMPVEPIANPEESTPAESAEAVPKTPEEEKQELISHMQQLQAEFDNYRKRVEQQQEEMKRAASDKILKDVLPFLDNMLLSVQHAKDPQGKIKGEDLLAGILMINEQLKSMLEQYGIQEIPDGGRFDPRLHEALTTVSQEGAERGTVLQTYQRGYTRGGKVFRPAKVSVAK